MNNEDVIFSPAFILSEKIKAGDFTSRELTQLFIERIEKYDHKLNAFCNRTFKLAMEMAGKADQKLKRGKHTSAIHGVPIAIKDDLAIEGIKTTYGCKIYENYVPNYTDISLKRLSAAGAVFLGKTNLPALGFKGVTDNLIFGPTKNPWDLERTPGGSSGGSAAAVAAGFAPIGMGSDGGGSVRIPSSFCGVFGLKPQFGRIPQIPSGTDDHTRTMVCEGFITQFVKDAALMLDLTSGIHHVDRYSIPKTSVNYYEECESFPLKLKVAYTINFGNLRFLDDAVSSNFQRSIEIFEDLSSQCEEIQIQIPKLEEVMTVFWTTSYAYSLQPYLSKWKDKLDKNLVECIAKGLTYSQEKIKEAEMQREMIYNAIYRIFKQFDVLITPTLACLPFRLGRSTPEKVNQIAIDDNFANMLAWTPYTYIFNLTGHPAASIPSGWSNTGLPIGLQIIGQRFDELTLLQVCKAFENVTPWQIKHPSL
jgi:aspartyl-tRNA(Asn)/glutamyl-tRNA(Gln) amidotransferase subunit A